MAEDHDFMKSRLDVETTITGRLVPAVSDQSENAVPLQFIPAGGGMIEPPRSGRPSKRPPSSPAIHGSKTRSSARLIGVRMTAK
jgi:hypothetical protein